MVRFRIGWIALLPWLAACPPAGDDRADAAIATESDVTPCGRTDTIYVNHTTVAKELFIRATNFCGRNEPTLLPGRIWVSDSAGNVIGGQEADLLFKRTHRGTFMVPGGAHIRLECPDHLTATEGCAWQYSVTVRF